MLKISIRCVIYGQHLKDCEEKNEQELLKFYLLLKVCSVVLGLMLQSFQPQTRILVAMGISTPR